MIPDLVTRETLFLLLFSFKLEDDPVGKCPPTLIPARNLRGGVARPRPHHESWSESDCNPGWPVPWPVLLLPLAQPPSGDVPNVHGTSFSYALFKHLLCAHDAEYRMNTAGPCPPGPWPRAGVAFPQKEPLNGCSQTAVQPGKCRNGGGLAAAT